jgi:hypothetical protein
MPGCGADAVLGSLENNLMASLKGLFCRSFDMSALSVIYK